MADPHPTGAQQGDAMVPTAVARPVFVCQTRLVIIVIPYAHSISHPKKQGHKEHFEQELLGVVVFPSGIENHGKDKEKQDLAQTPQHPFQLQSMFTEDYTYNNEGQKVDPNAI